MTWDTRGERLAITYAEGHLKAGHVALYCTVRAERALTALFVGLMTLTDSGSSLRPVLPPGLPGGGAASSKAD